jgi:hypothetical protein
MIKLDAKKSSLLIAAVMLAKLASAQGLPWLDEPPAQTDAAQKAPLDQRHFLKLWRRRLQPQPILPR